MKKNIGIELLRIICMFMILGLHFNMHGNILEQLNELTKFNGFFILMVECIFIVAVNVFVLISGYNLHSKKFKKERIINLLGKVWLINLIMCIIMYFTGNIALNIKNLLYFVLPFTLQEYWFVNTYVYLIILIPFINILIENIDKKNFNYLLLVLLVLNSILSCIPNVTVILNSGYSVIWFINLYLIGAYINKYNINIQKTHNFILYIFSILILTFSFVALYNLKSLNFAMKLLNYNNILVLIPSILLFNLALNINLSDNKSKLILFISQSCFSVYLITENIFTRNVLWNKLINTFKYCDTYIYPIYYLGILVLIFIVCIVIDKIIFIIPNYMKEGNKC